jgi:3-deoxy-D-manno-octulosonic-acid transferase
LFIAPRHIKRAKQVADIVKDRGLKFQFRSDFDGNSLKRIEKIVIINTIGELFSVYGVCALAFCGGSLVPLGGQNLLEAAVWGKPVFYGPFMDDFQEAKTLLEDAVGDCFLVKSGDELAKKSLFYLQNPEERINIGRQARAAVMNNQGAAEKHAGVVFNVLNNRGFIP